MYCCPFFPFSHFLYCFFFLSDFWVCGLWHECFLVVDWSSRPFLRTNDLVPDVVRDAFVPGFLMLYMASCGGTDSSCSPAVLEPLYQLSVMHAPWCHPTITVSLAKCTFLCHVE